MSNNCNRLFNPGKLTTIMDGGAGSSGKAKIASYVTDNADNWSFACNAFAPQAGHWTKLADGRTFFYQTLNSCAYNVDKYEKLYIGPGGTIELPAFFREMEQNKVPAHKIGISPLALILEDSDAAFERGQIGFDGGTLQAGETGTMKTGSTCHGVGSANARRLLRRPSVRTARDVPELKQFICDVPSEILARLNRGEAGLLEIAQGFQLSLLYDRFAPHTTYRQVTVAQALSDMFLPVKAAGQVLINLRTFPIRINSNKYIATADGRHLTSAEVEAGVPHTVFKGDSGPGYPDQREISWEDITKHAGSATPIREITSVTKLYRRAYTFSKLNVEESLKFNDTGHEMHLSVNFANYVDSKMAGATSVDQITPKMQTWIDENLGQFKPLLRIIGTGQNTHESILLP